MKRKLYQGQIPEKRTFFGKQYEHLGHSADEAIINEMIRGFQKVMGNKYSIHVTAQQVIPRGFAYPTPMKMYVIYTRKKKKC